MKTRTKTWTLIFLATAVFSLMLLASSLSTIDTNGQRPIVQVQGLLEEVAEEEEIVEETITEPSQFRQGLTFVLVGLAAAASAYVIWRISKLPAPRQRRSSFSGLGFFIVFLAIYFLTDGFKNLRMGSAIDRPVMFIGAPTLAFAFVVGLVPLALLGAYAYYIWRQSELSALDQLALEAEETLSQVQAGKDIRNAVVACYQRMCQVLQEERRMVRAEGMTPSEFASRLEGAGLPHREVVNLTRLFEAVRYGGHDFTPEEADDAVQCLSAIITAAQKSQSRPRPTPWSSHTPSTP